MATPTATSPTNRSTASATVSATLTSPTAASNFRPQVSKAGNPVTIEGDVKNTGSAAGDEVVELYLTQPKDSDTPIRVLAGFTRVHLGPGQSTHVGLTIDPRSIAQVDSKGTRMILSADYTVSLGGGQPNDAASVQTGKFTVAGRAELSK